MKKKFSFPLFVCLLLFAFFFFPRTVRAETCPDSDFTINGKNPLSLTTPYNTLLQLDIKLKVSGFKIKINPNNHTIEESDRFTICTDDCQATDAVARHLTPSNVVVLPGGQDLGEGWLNVQVPTSVEIPTGIGNHRLHVRNERWYVNGGSESCTLPYTITGDSSSLGYCIINLSSDTVGGLQFTPNNSISATGIVTMPGATGIRVVGPGVDRFFNVLFSNTGLVGQYSIQLGSYGNGTYLVGFPLLQEFLCKTCVVISDSGGRPCDAPATTGTIIVRDICEGDSTGECFVCFSKGDTWTALGCIPTSDLTGFAGWMMGKIIFVATGIAFLLMVFGAFQILTSSGDPKKVQGGQELITSAVSGLLFIILSLFLLKLIGVDILQIPGFSK